MSMKPHYFKIGLFVIVAVLLIVMVVVIFGAGLLARNEMHFESYFSESITGLSIGAPLEFRGVRVGRIEEIGFVGNVYDLVTIRPPALTTARTFAWSPPCPVRSCPNSRASRSRWP